MNKFIYILIPFIAIFTIGCGQELVSNSDTVTSDEVTDNSSTLTNIDNNNNNNSENNTNTNNFNGPDFEGLGIVAKPTIHARNQAPTALLLEGINDGSVNAMDVMEKNSESGAQYFNSYNVNSVEKMAFKSFKAGQDAIITFNHDKLFQLADANDKIRWIEWQYYGVNCLGSSDFTIPGYGSQGLPINKGAKSIKANEQCVRFTHMTYKTDEYHSLIIKSPPTGFQGVLSYRIRFRNGQTYNSLQGERIYFYVE